jgi:mono/diheme cytochrome c family protein
MRTRILVLLALLFFSGCGWQMSEQARYDAYEPSKLTDKGTSALTAPAGTVSRAEPSKRPLLTEKLLVRGRERYTIYCAVCHGERGRGNGVVVKHGYPAPPSFHLERLRTAGDLHFWSAITNGAGRMYPYADRVPPQDRWAIVEWIRVLQAAESTNLNDISPHLKERVLQRLAEEESS